MKSNVLSKVLIFAAGAAVGAVATWKLIDTKYQMQAIQEAEEIREYYRDKYETDICEESTEDVEESEEEDPAEKPSLQEYAAKVLGAGYTNYSSTTTQEKEVDTVGKPYVIAPEEFGETDYRTVSLTYYKDEVLADMRNKVVKNVDDVVGIDSLNHFGEYEDDSVFVRNDAKKTDYEILLDDRAYSEIINKTAHSAEDE